MPFFKNLIFFSLLISSLSVVAQRSKYGQESLALLPESPDYSNLNMWAAHPMKFDSADVVPGAGEFKANQENAAVDVFFVHPTIYSGKQHPTHPWNGDVYDEELNKSVDQSTIKNQATVFNGSARVYAPRYRQAHLQVFYVEDKDLKARALDFAYEDVKASFQYFLDNFHQGRPIIIASHSQGTVHAARLLSDFFDQKQLKMKLVAAYLVGMPLDKEMYQGILPCEAAEETGCWISWNTFRKGYFPDHFFTTYKNALSTNPLNWKIDDSYAGRDENLGGVLRKYEKIVPGVTDAQNHLGVLWSEKPHFPGRVFLTTKRYHIADYNLFYSNIRENVAERVGNYLSNTATIKN
jgi:hypothetical protein